MCNDRSFGASSGSRDAIRANKATAHMPIANASNTAAPPVAFIAADPPAAPNRRDNLEATPEDPAPNSQRAAAGPFAAQ
jgi:hypothetical protein